MRALIPLFLLAAAPLAAQTDAGQVGKVLSPVIEKPDVVAYQLRQYIAGKVAPLRATASAAEWTAEAARLRRRLLDDVVFHGWPREWVDAPPRFEDLGPVPSGPGYHMRKLRYEIVPGFQGAAILYLPEKLAGRVPAILNVNGHVGPPGKSVEYKQKRCINQALQGMIALNLEWLAFGELGGAENQHWFGAHLDLVGTSELGLFYLAMRRGLDYLEQYPGADPKRLGVTGLSGGGWQTIVLSALDERVRAAVPVAGYSSLLSRAERQADVGDMEQLASDSLAGVDYGHLTAMRAPRPTLLIYNAEDDCCFRAPMVKPYIFDRVQPFFALYGAADRFAWHENTDPSNHNYQLDNRVQAYRFFARAFGLPEVKSEIPVESEVKSFDELRVGLPAGNLTILGLARKLAAGTGRRSGTRERLREVVRYRATPLERPWALDNTKNKGLESISYRFDFAGGLSGTGVLLKAIDTARPRRATILLDDKGIKNAGADASDRVNRGEWVLPADLLFTGNSAPPSPHSFTMMLAALGERALGIEAAQLMGLANWLKKEKGVEAVRVEASGMRSQMVALAATALDPGLFSEIRVKNGIKSLATLLDGPVEFQAAPDLFCLDLFKDFDVARLEELGPGSR